MDHFACELYFTKATEDGTTEYDRKDKAIFISSIFELDQWIDMDYCVLDQLKEEEEIANLPDGSYYVFASGTVEIEEYRDWESGENDDVDIILGFETIHTHVWVGEKK